VLLKEFALMRRNTVKSGLRLIIWGIVSVILATFFHQEVANLLFLSPGGEDQLVYLGLFSGGTLGFLGIIVIVSGFLRTSTGERKEKLLPTLALLMLLILTFFVLLFVSFRMPEQPRLRPGETITI